MISKRTGIDYSCPTIVNPTRVIGSAAGNLFFDLIIPVAIGPVEDFLDGARIRLDAGPGLFPDHLELSRRRQITTVPIAALLRACHAKRQGRCGQRHAYSK